MSPGKSLLPSILGASYFYIHHSWVFIVTAWQKEVQKQQDFSGALYTKGKNCQKSFNLRYLTFTYSRFGIMALLAIVAKP